MSAQLTVNAYAKINLTLEVVRRLPSGYHEIRTIFQQVGLCDELVLENAPAGGIDLACDDPTLALGPSNLVWRAATRMLPLNRSGSGVHIRIRKRLPVGGGLAGGSADAAATLIGLNRLWRLGLSQQQLIALGFELGMDVPFCVMGGTALGAGRGEDLAPLPSLPPFDVVIAHPGVSSSTAEAYAGLQPRHMGGGAMTGAMAEAIRRQDKRAIAAGLYNVFEENVIGRLPQIGCIKQIMLEHGAWNVLMSGSGACVFALAGSGGEAEAIAAAVRREFVHVYVTHTRK